jgi:hypothetical protein
MLVETRRQAGAAGGCVRLVAPSQPALECLRSTRPAWGFPVFDSMEQALLLTTLENEAIATLETKPPRQMDG